MNSLSETGAMASKMTRRSISLLFLRPLQHLLNVLFFAYGFGFLLRFVLELYGSSGLSAWWPVALLWAMTDWVLQPLQAVLGTPESVPAGAIQLLPLALSVLIWMSRRWLIEKVRGVALRLEERDAKALFTPRRVAQAAEMAEPYEYARLLPSDEPVDADAAAGSTARTPDSAAGRAAALAKRRIPPIAGRYELMEELGQGSAIAVYKALDLRIGRVVAVKFLRADARYPEEQMRQQKERLWREARTAGKLMHPGIVTVLDVAEDGAGHPYLVMEFVEGDTLDQALARKDHERLPDLVRRLDLAVEIARTLDYAHRHGVVHRDIKPANILLTANGHVKIADFGIALLARTPAAASDPVPGTPGFVAPELLHGAVAGACSDVFSLGVVLYWMFTGEMPFQGRSVTEITHQVAHVHPLPARQVNWALPLELEEILNKCLAKDPAERYTSAAQLVADLAVLREGRFGVPSPSNPAREPAALPSHPSA